MEDSQLNKSNMMKKIKLPNAYDVALSGYDAMIRAKPVRIYGFMNKLVVFTVRLMPRKWIVALSRKIQG